MRDYAAIRTQALKLLQREGRVAYCHASVAGAALRWFIAGFDTADLQEARTLLEQ